MINLLIPKQARVSDTDLKRYLRTELKMRDPVKLLGFVFWLFFFNSGQCQECLRENINYENIELAEKASYSDGETVRVNCMTGFTGMYRLKCEKGEWKKTTGRPCAKKKCSHPGDTENGDFKLEGGSDFVFGVTASYTCKKGFYMASRINQRTCRAQGWDNTVPVCEIMKCPAIRTDGDVTAIGNTEDGSYGDAVHFECVSSNKKIHGSSEIYCTERGEWSKSIPTCKEITCTPPDILHGRVLDRMQEYPKDAILKYSCSKGFKPREGIPRCAKFGWTLNPECDVLACQLNSRIFGANKINPEGKTLFRVGESVEITCAENHWFRTKETSRSFTCLESGNWDHEPICAEIRCEVPHNQYVSYPEYYFRGNMKLGAVKTYYCMRGYEQKAAEATCTREGWTPKPLCAERTCAAPNIPNANIEGEGRQKYIISSKIQYKCHRGFEPEQPVEITCTEYGWTGIQQCTAKKHFCPDPSVVNGFIYRSSSNEEEIFYTCNTGYKPFSGNWWDSVKCSEGSWSEEPRCIPEEECGAFPTVDHGKIKQKKQIFRHGDTTELECDPGFKPTQSVIKCVRGEWETPVCEVDVRCGIPPKVENALITSKPKELYLDGSSVTYACRGSFLMNGKNTVLCRSGSWEEAPTCTEVTCPLNTAVDDLMEPSPNYEGPFKPGQTLTFSCNRQGLKLIGQREITCQSNGEWSSPFPKCEEVKCVAKLTRRMRSDATEDEHTGTEISVRPGRTITLTCNGDGVKLQGPNKITCQSNGEWNIPFPKCIGGKCGPPPTNVEFGDTKDMPKQEYDSGETVEYECFNKYTLDESDPYSKHLTCDNGEWTGNIRCLEPCSVTVEEMDKRGIELRWGGRQKLISPHEDRITFKCLWGKYSTDIALVQTCNDGELNLPLCV